MSYQIGFEFRSPTQTDNKVIVQTPIQLSSFIKEGVEKRIWLKREDLFNVCGANGAKARSAHFLIARAKEQGFKGVTTAGSRKSPQINIVAQIAKRLDLKFVAHCPMGELSDELLDAKKNGAIIIQHKAGYNSVIMKRCIDYAQENNMYEVPFGMKCHEAITQTKLQVKDIPIACKRIVIPVGSGMNLCGLLNGMKEQNIDLPVFGVIVGAKPYKVLEHFAPANWQKNVTLLKSTLDYHSEETNNRMADTLFDPVYEGKCLKYLEEDDLFWVVGIRKTLLAEGIGDNTFCNI